MVSNKPKKRVRIQTGHETRYVEKSNKSKKSRVRMGKVGRSRTHRPTVAELVYQFLERASNRGVARNQKSNATNQFRKMQRRKYPKPLRSKKRIRTRRGTPFADSFDRKNFRKKLADLPSEEGKECIEKCIYDVLSFGTILGLLEPVDETGAVFRVSTDLHLFEKKRAPSRNRSEPPSPCDDDSVDDSPTLPKQTCSMLPYIS